MIIRATIEDLEKYIACFADGMKEWAEEGWAMPLNENCFLSTWKGLLATGIGVIWLLIDEDSGMPVGALGAIKFPDPNNGVLTASEMFWYVKKDYRGQGMKLLELFEGWAEENGCGHITMVHLTDIMPDILKRVYERRGYKAREVHYFKEV